MVEGGLGWFGMGQIWTGGFFFLFRVEVMVNFVKN